ncbi:MAG: hypothetical protein OEM28_00595 [Nitrosopumilus sp.]|nr:hypothetical protein [Nitrosopumilus sp.]MDH3487294.1 hypothetical protein [Nitrosopumilus sp.]
MKGLQKLSSSSVNSLQIKREKAFSKAKDALNDLITNTKIMKNTEKQYQKTL